MSMKTFQISFFCALALLLGACDEVAQPSLNEEHVSSFVGPLVDSRDGQTYRTVTIGSQVWMAENLNYVTSGSYCYDDDTSYCSKYGRLYKWAAAVGKSQGDCGSGNSCVLPSGTVQGVCPDGWHLPSEDDWYILKIEAAGDCRGSCASKQVGHTLKSTSGWSVSESMSSWREELNGSDQFFFSALPAGSRNIGGIYSGLGSASAFWTSTELSDSNVFCAKLGSDKLVNGDFIDAFFISNINKDFASSVRCVKDNGIRISTSSLIGKSSTFTDSRDGQVYKTVQIGRQTWMAQNLNYDMDSSLCYNDYENQMFWVPLDYYNEVNCAKYGCFYNEVSDCTKYGRYYTWNDALVACPSGWHLPSDMEWFSLHDVIMSSDDLFEHQIGESLMSISGWKRGNGTDVFGFSALPAGWMENYDESFSDDGLDVFWHFDREGVGAYFWSAASPTESEHDDWAYLMGIGVHYADMSALPKDIRLSVRCLKD